MKELTEKYITHFNDKNLNQAVELLHEDVILTDPANRFSGREQVSDEMKKIFDSSENLSFSAKNVFYDTERQTSIIEFALDLDGVHLEGTDVIQWEDDKIKELRAYLNLPTPA